MLNTHGDNYVNYDKHVTNIDLSNFRQNTALHWMVEGESIQTGIHIMNIIENEFPDYLTIINDNVFINDLLGNPMKTFKYKNYNISASLPRYLWYAFDIISKLNKNNINSVKIFEIGGGYGALARVLLSVCPSFNIKIYKYTMVDLKNVSILQEKYLKHFKFNNTYHIPYDDLNEQKDNIDFDLVISSGCIGEIPNDDIRLFYINNFINKSKYVHLFWNNSQNDIHFINKHLSHLNKENIFKLFALQAHPGCDWLQLSLYKHE